MAGGLKERLKSIGRLNGTGYSVGLQGEGGAPGRSTDAEMAENATRNEFGLDGASERPAIRSATAQHGDKWGKGAARVGRFVARGDEAGARRAEEQLGVVMVRDVQRSMTSGVWTPNTASTIARKGAGKPPLVDTGQTVASVRAAREFADGTKELI